MKLHIDQLFLRTSLDRFVEVYFSEAFNTAVAPVAGLKERRLVEEKRLDDGRIERRVRLVPDVSLPGPVEKLVAGRAISYDEVSVYDPARQEVRWRIDHRAGDRLKVAGTIRFVEAEGGVRRIIDGDIDVAVFGVGGLVERFIEAETRKGYEKIGAFMQRYLDDDARARQA